MAENISRAGRPAHLGWRLLALVYDSLVNIALWFVVSALALLLNPAHTAFAPWTPGFWLTWLACWALSGSYAVFAWRRGGATLGMKPWRLQVVAGDGRLATTPVLWRRYAVATLSLLAGGLGFLWALIDRERRTWHDLASGTAMVRLDKVTKNRA